MRDSIKKRLRAWLGLACIFLAGASAGAFGYGLCGMLTDGFSGDVESHQSMRPHATGDEIGLESKTRLKRETCGANRAIGQQLETPAIFHYCAFFQSNMNDAVRQILRADDRQYCALIFQQIADSDLNLAVLIAQRHLSAGETFDQKQQPHQHKDGAEQPTGNLALFAHPTPNRLMAALRYRQLYTCQNQFISRIVFSYLRDARKCTSVTHVSSISCPRPLVLRQLAVSALEMPPRTGKPESARLANGGLSQTAKASYA
jgi:hypothetical protein